MVASPPRLSPFRRINLKLYTPARNAIRGLRFSPFQCNDSSLAAWPLSSAAWSLTARSTASCRSLAARSPPHACNHHGREQRHPASARVEAAAQAGVKKEEDVVTRHPRPGRRRRWLWSVSGDRKAGFAVGSSGRRGAGAPSAPAAGGAFRTRPRVFSRPCGRAG